MLTSILLLASLLTTPVQGDQFEVVAVLQTVDSGSRMITAFANGRDRTLLVAAEAQILDESGQPLKDGLNSKQLVEGLNVSLTVQRGDRAPTILVLQIGKKSSGGLNFRKRNAELRSKKFGGAQPPSTAIRHALAANLECGDSSPLFRRRLVAVDVLKRFGKTRAVHRWRERRAHHSVRSILVIRRRQVASGKR